MLHKAASIAVPKLAMHIQTKWTKEISTAERLCSHTNVSHSSGHRIVSIHVSNFRTARETVHPPYL